MKLSKLHDFSMTFDVFSKFHDFPWLFQKILFFQVFQVFQTLWEPWQFSLRDILKPSVTCRRKMYFEQRLQSMLQLHLSDQKFYCLLKRILYYRLDGIYFIVFLWADSGINDVQYFVSRFNSLASGRCGSNFKCITLKLILQKNTLDLLKWLSSECRNTLLAIRHQAITWAYINPDLYRWMTSLGHNEIII